MPRGFVSPREGIIQQTRAVEVRLRRAQLGGIEVDGLSAEHRFAGLRAQAATSKARSRGHLQLRSLALLLVAKAVPGLSPCVQAAELTAKDMPLIEGRLANNHGSGYAFGDTAPVFFADEVFSVVG